MFIPSLVEQVQLGADGQDVDGGLGLAAERHRPVAGGAAGGHDAE